MSKPIYIKTLEGLRRREGLFRVLVFTLVTVVFWIGFNIYQANSQTKISVDIQKHTQQLNPNINRTALEELARRTRYSPEELQEFPIYERVTSDDGISSIQVVGSNTVVTITSEDEETPAASDEATVQEEPEATTSAIPATTTPAIATDSASN
jgi:hypothetical protein